MNCQEFADFLAEYVDKSLPEVQITAFEMHIADCPPCGSYLKSYELTIRLGKDALCPDEAIPPDVPEDLIQAILRARRNT
jgi:hypothetical protein